MCSLQVGFGGVRCVVGKERVRVGCSPVGLLKDVVKVRGWGWGRGEEDWERRG